MKVLLRCCATLAAAGGLVGLGVGLERSAIGQAAPLRELFLELDANQDGSIAKEEVPANGRPAFDRLLKQGDANHNGKLEASEFRAVLDDMQEFAKEARNKAARRFDSMDKDHDGKVTREEFTGPKPRFDLLDQNGDGSLAREEFLNGALGKAAAKKQANAAKKADAVKKKKAGASEKTEKTAKTG